MRSTDGRRLKFMSTTRLVKLLYYDMHRVVTLPQILNELRVALSSCTEELEQVSLAPYHKKIINDITTVKKINGF